MAEERDGFIPDTFAPRGFWWNLNARRMYTLESVLEPEACRTALETILRPALNNWNRVQGLPLGAPLRKRRLRIVIDERSFQIDDEWGANVSAIRDGLVLQGTLESSLSGGTRIALKASGRSYRLIATPAAVLLLIVLVWSVVGGYSYGGLPRPVTAVLAVALPIVYAYGYAVASVTVGTDVLFLLPNFGPK